MSRTCANNRTTQRVAGARFLDELITYVVEGPIRYSRLFKTPTRAILLTITTIALVGMVSTSSFATFPGSGTASAAIARGQQPIAGAGGYMNEPLIKLQRPLPNSRSPLRVMLVGDSVMFVAETGLNAALESTHAVVVSDNAIDGFGLSIATDWRQSLQFLLKAEHPQIILATWGWDDTCTSDPRIQKEPCALEEPAAYRRELTEAVKLALNHGDGVEGIVFLQYPLLGPLGGLDASSSQQAMNRRLFRGQMAWQSIVRGLPSRFPHRVMYLPVGDSVLLHGRFSSWLPPPATPNAPEKEWVRVRMIDNVHMCPAGVVRFSRAVLSDLTNLFDLPRATSTWSTGGWTKSDRFNDPPGSCPSDHPH